MVVPLAKLSLISFFQIELISVMSIQEETKSEGPTAFVSATNKRFPDDRRDGNSSQKPRPIGRLIVLLFVVGNEQGQFTESTESLIASIRNFSLFLPEVLTGSRHEISLGHEWK